FGVTITPGMIEVASAGKGRENTSQSETRLVRHPTPRHRVELPGGRVRRGLAPVDRPDAGQVEASRPGDDRASQTAFVSRGRQFRLTGEVGAGVEARDRDVPFA